MSSNEMYIRMTETKISRLIPRLAIPTIITMLVTSIYNMADTFFVSQIGTSASAAVGINFFTYGNDSSYRFYIRDGKWKLCF